MLALYLRRIARPLAVAFSISLLIILLGIPSLVLPTGLVLFYIINIPLVRLFSYLFSDLRRPYGIILASILSVSIALLSIYFLFTPTFLLLNALPFAFSKTLLALTTLFVQFEHHIRLPEYKLGPDFSLIKLILNPRVQLRAVQVRMANDLFVRHLRRERLDRQETLVLVRALQNEFIQRSLFERAISEGLIQVGGNNHPRATSPNRAQEQLNRAAQDEADQQNPDLLRLSEADTVSLRSRQTAAIQALPSAAVINDRQIFQHYINAGQSNLEAIASTKAHVAELETMYSSTLTPAQQIRYKAYRDLIQRIDYPYAECPVTLQNITEADLNTFIIMEQRNVNAPDTCIPAKAKVLSYADGFISLFSITTAYRASDPTTHEKYFGIHGTKTGFVFHTYEIVEGHVLSLQLTECIEKFVHTLSLAPEEVDVIDEVIEEEAIPDYRRAAADTNVSIATNNIFSPAADGDVEWANILAGLNLSEEELAFNRNQM